MQRLDLDAGVWRDQQSSLAVTMLLSSAVSGVILIVRVMKLMLLGTVRLGRLVAKMATQMGPNYDVMPCSSSSLHSLRMWEVLQPRHKRVMQLEQLTDQV